MPEGQLSGVQVVAGVAGHRPGSRGGEAAGEIERIAHERESSGSQVNADLVRTARPDADVAKEAAHASLEDGHVGPGWLSGRR